MEEQEFKNLIKQEISGFKPEVTGGICDMCNRGLSTDETVLISAYYRKETDDLVISRTHCSDCGNELPDREISSPEAIIQCTLGESAGRNVYPLLNPTVKQMNT